MKWSFSWFLIFILVMTENQPLPAKSLLQTLRTGQRKKLDPVLQLVLDDPGQMDARVIRAMKKPNQPALWPVLLKSHQNPGAVIHQLGGFVGSKHGLIYTAFVPASGIAELSRLPFVEYMQAATQLKEELDTSLSNNGTTFVHAIPPGGIRGQGVIIGITDSGIDLSHPDFKDENGKSRILFLWDQYASGSPHPPGFSYGREFNREELNSGTLLSKDTDGHGTRVAGVAAGNGQAGRFVGVAPAADLIIVKARGGMVANIIEEELNTAGLLDAYAYIRQKARELGKPCVINTSRGTTIGPHDGTTLLSQAVNAEVAAGAIIVVSAGNYSNDNRHGEAVARPNTPISFKVKIGSGEKSVYFDFWYETNDAFRLEVAGPSGSFTTPMFGDSLHMFYQHDGRVKIVSTMNSPLNTDNEFFVRVYNPLDRAWIEPGTWTFHFTSISGNTLPDGGEIHGWIIRDVKAEFLNFVDRTETIGELACSDSVISVASFNNKTFPSGKLSSFSSYGPRRDGALKPDIAAAGGGVVSTRSQQSDSSPYQRNTYYAYGSGTSYAAPHVTGAVALLLELNPTLRATRVMRILQQTAKADLYTGITPNEKWGYGKLDVLNMVRQYLTEVLVRGVAQAGGKPVAGELVLTAEVSGYPEMERSL